MFYIYEYKKYYFKPRNNGDEKCHKQTILYRQRRIAIGKMP